MVMASPADFGATNATKESNENSFACRRRYLPCLVGRLAARTDGLRYERCQDDVDDNNGGGGSSEKK